MSVPIFKPFPIATVVVAVLAGCATQSTSVSTSTGGALIPREAIFGNPERVGARISPDGKLITFLAPRDGVLNIWVVERGRPFSEARPLTAEKTRPPSLGG